MKFWPLLWSNLKRKKARTTFTVLSIVVAFVLFAYLAAIRVAFSAGVDVAGADRLFTTHKTSIIQPLPVSYLDQIARVRELCDAGLGPLATAADEPAGCPHCRCHQQEQDSGGDRTGFSASHCPCSMHVAQAVLPSAGRDVVAPTAAIDDLLKQKSLPPVIRNAAILQAHQRH